MGRRQFSVKIRREIRVNGRESYNAKNWNLSATFGCRCYVMGLAKK